MPKEQVKLAPSQKSVHHHWKILGFHHKIQIKQLLDYFPALLSPFTSSYLLHHQNLGCHHHVLPLPLRMDVWVRFFQLSRHMAATLLITYFCWFEAKEFTVIDQGIVGCTPTCQHTPKLNGKISILLIDFKWVMIYSPMGTLLGVHPILPWDEAFPLPANDIQGGCVSKTTQMVHQPLAPVMSSYSLMVAVEDIWFVCLTQKILIVTSSCSFQIQFASITYLAGNKNAITTLKRGGDAVQKSEKTLLVIYDEESIIARLGLPAAQKIPSCSSFDRLPKAWSKAQLCHQASWDSACAHATKWGKGCEESKACTNHNIWLIFKMLFTHHFLPSSHFCIRLHYNGTNRGDVIYGAKMPSLDGSTIWKMTVGEKKELYGKHRIAVGGAAPADAIEEGGLDLFNEMIHIIIISKTLCHGEKCWYPWDGTLNIKGPWGVPITVYPWYLLCSLGILGDNLPINTHYIGLIQGSPIGVCW